jgi:hypothetical protein
VAGGDEEARLRHALAHPVEGGEHQLLLAPDRAPGHPQRPRRRAALEEAREALRDPPGLDGVELEVARHLHAVGGCSERPDALGVGLSLHEEAVDLGEHRREEPPHALVAGERARRDAAVDEGDPGAAPPRLVDEVGPELRLDEDEERWDGTSGPGGGAGVERRGAVHAAHTLFFATALPVIVVVERKTRCPGKRSRSAGTRGRAARTSPTDTAWIQMDRSPSTFR